MLNQAIEKEITRIRNLRQNKKKDIASIEKIAKNNIWKKQINIGDKFNTSEDKKQAEELFDSYLTNFHLESFTDAQNCADLVYEEMLKEQLQKELAKSDNKNKSFVVEKQIDALHKIQDKIDQLKQKIGIVGKKENDPLAVLETLKRKFKIWNIFNRNECTIWLGMSCSECGKKDVRPILLRRRVKNFDVLEHPAFCGRFLYNKEIFDDLNANKITNDMAARYLRTSTKYIEWALKNEKKILATPQDIRLEVEAYVNDMPYLRFAEEYKETHGK